MPVGPAGVPPGSSSGGTRREIDRHPISRAKITPTPVHDTTLSRERLLDWLRENVRRRLTLITAEAGYGKTTLLADFSRRGYVRCLWYKLDSNDRDWITFVNYLVAAAREIRPGFGESTSALLRHLAVTNPSRDLVLSTLLAELDSLGPEPTLLILDDYHLVDESPEIKEIVQRLVREGPETLTLLISGRRRPGLPLGRLAAQGELAELTTNELRFLVEETERLFEEIYGQSLDSDLLQQVDARTEGWAASLQLLHSSIRGRSAHEVRAFVGSLSGAERPLYDFLAEEVMGELRPEMQRLLTYASLLERVVPDHLTAIFAGDEEQPGREDVVRLMEEADRLGLLSRGGEGSTMLRFHPLLRDFLQRRLRDTVSRDALRAMHARVARAAETEDWLAACHHYIEAGEPREAMRVLSDSVLLALGSGRWKAAAGILERLRAANVNPAAAVILARCEVDAGRVDAALAVLGRIDVRPLDSGPRALVRAARMTAHWWKGEPEQVARVARDCLSDSKTPASLRELAKAHLLLVESNLGFTPALEHLLKLAEEHRRAGLYFYAGVDLHNAMTLEWFGANYQNALRLGHEALEAFRLTTSNPREAFSTHATLATCATELGDASLAEEHARSATAVGVRDADALWECAYAACFTGELARAHELAESAATLAQMPTRDIATTSIGSLVEAAIALTAGEGSRARTFLAGVDSSAYFDLGGRTSILALSATVALACQDLDAAAALAEEGLALARRLGGRRWEMVFEIVAAAGGRDPERLRVAVARAARTGRLSLLEVADILAPSFHLLDPIPRAVEVSVEEWPARWLPVIRRQLQQGASEAGPVLARLLERFGTHADVPLLRAYERRYMKRNRQKGLGLSLARRTSPRMYIRDLGRTWFEVGGRSVVLSRIRRKAASLLVYLITRPSTTAAREQVLDDLWPDLDPAAAANSLNQTLYFLRREIDPWYDDDVSVDYVRFESEMIWLDPELVSVASIEFLRAAEQVMTAERSDERRAIDLIRSYPGRFAPEFEYEEWAMAWRDTVHAKYLHLVEVVQIRLVESLRLPEAIDIAQRALQVDPEASEVERALVWLYSSLGARSAAAEQYEHYAFAHRDQFGVEPPSFADVTKGPMRPVGP